MRLLTHNQLVCVRKGCANHYPLDIQVTKVEATHGVEDDDDEEDEPNLEFVLHLLPTLDYTVLYNAATKLGLTGLPETIDVSALDKSTDKELLTRLHQVLLDTHIQEGSLLCAKCGRSYPIQQGIPNMRLNEDEVQ